MEEREMEAITPNLEAESPLEAIPAESAETAPIPEEQMAMEQAMMDEQARQEEQQRLEQERQMQEQMAMEQAMMEEQARQEEATRLEQERQMQEQMAAEQAMMEAMTDAERLRPIPGLYDPATLDPHPLANLLPMMRPKEFAELRGSIDLDGLQNPIVLFQGLILDGRNRAGACRELGRMVPVFEFTGSDQEALQYVLSSNQHRRDLTASQRAAVAVDILPQISEGVNQKRIEKIRATKAKQAENDTLSNLTRSAEESENWVSARLLAADMMGVSDGYVGLAKQIKDADPELFEKVRSGELTLSKALAALDANPADPLDTRIKSVRKEQNKLLKNRDLAPALLDRMEAVLAEFAER